MKIKSYVTAEDSAQVDLTPLIDVVFILLIFFILSATFQKDSSIPIDRPSSSSSTQSENRSLNVTIDESGQLWFEEARVSLSKLKTLASIQVQVQPMSNAVIKADKRVPTGKLIEVIDSLRLVGVGNVAVATQEK
ncbi:ExbD/TolR family protein [Vibrio tapetis]|uniref:Biopolymer transport ExbD/TolR family protein n=1 Tax=Vibrio tapetis subsp. tapetis TaxID=1671868 RepID=A0A2N8ZAQ2_9VIBR|nr:biopolymer transporter ExbD [Vibrio tapetis]SON48957.1 Biopolymer transport ExbD/TolR family protein [Vibrio tapetis subsp. tapetis]